MIPHRYNEETSLLLQQEQLITAKTPLPWDQFWIILVLHFSQSLVFKTLAPFIPQVSTLSSAQSRRSAKQNLVKLIKDIGVTNGDEQQVGYFVSFLVSMFYPSMSYVPY